MRDYLLLTIILGSLPVCILRPYFGIYMWYWIAFMNPHRFTWTFAHNFNVALCVGAATIIGFFVTRDRSRFPKEREAYLLIGLVILFTLNTAFAMFPENAWQKWEQVMKIILMTFMTMLLINERQKLRYLLLIITLSIGFFALKGVPWGIITGGQFRLQGPPESFIASNNDIGLALNITIPLMLFLGRNEPNKKLAYFIILCFSPLFLVLF